jgi:chemotaxis protein MotB
MRRSRRHTEEEHENHERWLVSYADFITLLFAFFVVMYAISQVNEGKYRVLANSLNQAFSVIPGAAAGPQVEVPGRLVAVPKKSPEEIRMEQLKRRNMERMRSMARAIMDALAPLVKGGQVRVTEGPIGITVEINASVLFQPGEARLEAEAVRALTAIAQILASSDFPIIVEGHTDNVPITTMQFPSNWELSGVRASSVVRLFTSEGVAAKRLSATGYADQRPIADNESPEGRARNRRVAITIEARTVDVLAEGGLGLTTEK